MLNDYWVENYDLKTLKTILDHSGKSKFPLGQLSNYFTKTKIILAEFQAMKIFAI